MKKVYELVYSNSAKVNMGDYEQLSPFYSTKIVIEVPEDVSVDVRQEYEKLRSDVDSLLKTNVENIRNAKKAKELGNFKFYTKDGKQYVSVTSVLSPEPKTPEDEERLRPYGARGTAKHRIFATLVNTGKLEVPTKEEEEACASVGGFVGYDLWFVGDKRFDFSVAEVEVYNDKELYAGKYDAKGFFEDLKAKYDLKSGSLDKKGLDNAFMQLAAYDACEEEPSDCLVVLPIGPKAKKEPIVARGEEIKKYYDMFLAKRKAFRDKYGC